MLHQIIGIYYIIYIQYIKYIKNNSEWQQYTNDTSNKYEICTHDLIVLQSLSESTIKTNTKHLKINYVAEIQ